MLIELGHRRGMGAVRDDARAILAAAGAGAGAAARDQTNQALSSLVLRAQNVTNRIAAGLSPPRSAPPPGMGQWGRVVVVGLGAAVLLVMFGGGRKG